MAVATREPAVPEELGWGWDEAEADQFVSSPFLPKQQVVANLMRAALPGTRTLIGYGGGVGGGKATTLCSDIYTPFGIRKMGDIRVGSLVSNPDGTIASVIGVYPQGVQPIYRVGFSDGTSVRTTLDHKWLVKLASRKYKAARQYEDGTRVVGRITTTGWLKNYLENVRPAKYAVTSAFWPLIPLPKPVVFTRPHQNRWGSFRKVDPYLLGALLGDGCLRNGQIGFYSMDQEIIRTIREALPIGCSIVKDGEEGASWRLNGVADLREELSKLGVYGKLAQDKFLPDAYKFAPIDARRAVLAGLMDTDGTADSRGHASFCSVSKRLSEDVQFLVRSLGGNATITTSPGSYRDANGQKVECQLSYDVYIQTPDNASLFRLARKRERCEGKPYNGGDGDLRRRLVSVEGDGSDEAQC